MGLGYLALAAAGAGCWAFALAESRRRQRLVGWLVAAALAALAVRGTLAWLLAQHALGFAQEKLFVGLPLSVAASALAAAMWWMPRRTPSTRRDAITGGSFAAAAAAALTEIVLTVAVGAPVGPAAAVSSIVVVAGAGAVTALARGGTTRRPAIAASAASGLLVVGAVVVGFIGSTGAGALQAGGFGPTVAHAPGEAPGAVPGTSIIELTAAPTAPPRVGETIPIELAAQEQRIALRSGASVDAWTFGALAGPAIVARVGDTLAMRLTNVDVDAGATVHWHGYPVANAFDGVAGVTQDAVVPGAVFEADVLMTQPGTYWYHTHQRGSEGVVRGLYGTLVVQPAGGQTEDVDLVLPVHSFSGHVVLGTSDELESRVVSTGDSVRVRLINTDQAPQTFMVDGAPFRVVALDGTAVASDPIERRSIVLAAGGRADLVLEMPSTVVRVGVATARTAGLALVPTANAEIPDLAVPDDAFDPLRDLIPTKPDHSEAAREIEAAITAERFDVERSVVLDRQPRLVDGAPNYAYTVDGRVYPFIEPTVVDEGDTVRIRLVNRSFETHPMHPHGHSVRVLSVDGRAPTQPLWLDTFDVGPGEVWEVALYADNPGIWMDHCHNLEHAALGMVTHLAYRGITTPFDHGGDMGNDPE